MYVIMAWGIIKSGAWDRFENHYEEKVAPLTKGMKGLVKRQLWRGTTDSQEAVAWSVWDTLQDLMSYETSETRRDLAQEADQYYNPWAYTKGESWARHFEVVSASNK